MDVCVCVLRAQLAAAVLRLSHCPANPHLHMWSRADGRLIGVCDGSESTLVVELDAEADEVKQWQTRNPYLTDRRPELYGALSAIRGRK